MRRVWAKDAELLVKIGRELDKQELDVTVTLPRALASGAVRSWDRDDDEDVDLDRSTETPSQRRKRHRAGTVGLIGNSVKVLGRRRGGKVKVRLHPWFIADALRAFYDED
jgi:hypothetical protein